VTLCDGRRVAASGSGLTINIGAEGAHSVKLSIIRSDVLPGTSLLFRTRHSSPPPLSLERLQAGAKCSAPSKYAFRIDRAASKAIGVVGRGCLNRNRPKDVALHSGFLGSATSSGLVVFRERAHRRNMSA